MSRVLVVAVLLAGCIGGGSGPDAPAGLTGRWAYETPSGGCATVMEFREDDTYTTRLACTGRADLEAFRPVNEWLEDEYGPESTFDISRPVPGTLDMLLEQGFYTARGTELTLSTTASTCLGASPEPRDFAFRVDGDALILVSEGGELVLGRLHRGGFANALVRYGCFVEGEFYPGELAPL